MAFLLVLVALAQPAADFGLSNPRAIELFDRDPQLMRWALSQFDANGDGYLSTVDADRAAIEFKRIADGDRDGQVTPTEYRAARDFVVARWAVR